MNTVQVVGPQAITAVRAVAQETWDSGPLLDGAVREGGRAGRRINWRPAATSFSR